MKPLCQDISSVFFLALLFGLEEVGKRDHGHRRKRYPAPDSRQVYLVLTTISFSMLYDAFIISKSMLKEVAIVGEICAPMGGKILDVMVKVGDTVNENDEVVILEAMKMELPVVATESGTVKEVKCGKGDAVEADAPLIIVE